MIFTNKEEDFMSEIVMEAARLMEILPDHYKKLAYNLIKISNHMGS